MPRLVRKAPLAERIQAYLDPWDWLMWASEELNSNDWEEFAKSYALSLGFGMNVLFVIAKANAGRASSSAGDDVFGDYQRSGGGWFKWFMNLLVLALSILSFSNAFYTFYRKRHYRLFEQPVDADISTPSAQRVRVDSSPMASSPFRFLQTIAASSSAQSRAHPDAARDVWEIAVWDPNPLCLHIFCIFSPLHVLLYYFALPVAPLDPQPSVKVVTTLFMACILSAHLLFLRNSYTRQSKDNAIIQREVMHEYDAKFVHPLVQRPSRDVAVQVVETSKGRSTRHSGVGTPSGTDLASEVDTYTPMTIVNKGFRTHPNQAYASQYDPDNLSSIPQQRMLKTSSIQTPSLRPMQSGHYTAPSTATGADFSSPIRPSNTPGPFPQPSFRQSQVGRGDGGNLGVYSHAASPLRKAASTNFLQDKRESSSRNSLGGAGERRRDASPTKREGSPLKRMSTPSGFTPSGNIGAGVPDRFAKGYSGLGIGRRESGRF